MIYITNLYVTVILNMNKYATSTRKERKRERKRKGRMKQHTKNIPPPGSENVNVSYFTSVNQLTLEILPEGNQN